VVFEIGEVISGEVSHPVRETGYDEYSIMFHNVWGYTIKVNPLSARADLAMEIYREYMPDIIGFQEVSNPHYEQATVVFNGLKQLGYQEIRFLRFGYGNPIYFNSRKLYPVECGYQRARRGDKNNIWAVFADRDSDKPVFALINSHFAADSNAERNHELGNQYRADDARSLVKTVGMIHQHFPGIPVITGGDYNSGGDSEAIKVLYENGLVNVRELIPDATPVSPFRAPKYIAEEDRYEYCRKPELPHAKHCIDYAMTYGPTKDTVTFKEYRILTDSISYLTSDHKPHVLYVSMPAWEEPTEG
jgi:endonuclease/exonuclease/phosphatase family metal-dependent hydrolase